MPDTCIVCLGDLGESENEPSNPVAPEVQSEDTRGRLLHSSSQPTHDLGNPAVEIIAHLLPCGHNLHDDCLKPWVERANSCPICRQSFNLVELSAKIGGKWRSGHFSGGLDVLICVIVGPVISSYTVSDRTQVADLDPSLLIEEFDDLDSQPCAICGDDDNEDCLLPCDGCSEEFHTYCVNLEEIPAGEWLCETCATQRAIDSVYLRAVRRPHNSTDQRAREQRRSARIHNQASSSSWARVWQSVWDRLNLDLDFPFDEGSNNLSTGTSHQTLQDRREFRQWERRLQVAERQAGTNRFGDTASTLLGLRPPRERPPPPECESNEEIRAWNALDKAQEIELDLTPNSRKRKSADSSPSDQEPAPQQERPFKRPRTRRTMDLGESSDNAQSEASVRGGLSAKRTIPHKPDANGTTLSSNGPSFLQSLLNEVESSATPDENRGRARPSMISVTGHSSPQVSSPGGSPTSSNYASPRALSRTPPPFPSTRPGSPFSLTSKVEPIFPPPEFSPERSPTESYNNYRSYPDSRAVYINEVRQARPRFQMSPYSNLPRSEETSPTRLNISLSAKSDVQKMVSAALKPFYKSNIISKDQYTDINRNISRMIYEKIGDTGTVNGEAKESWERLASIEVAKAVESLKATT